jgi:hypothetical protein
MNQPKAKRSQTIANTFHIGLNLMKISLHGFSAGERHVFHIPIHSILAQMLALLTGRRAVGAVLVNL